ncbi:hypothetical protein [Microcoleus sp. B4-D4]|uniref:hypothetical protein n=1 Tax=Microcoleus sp. B4-D4 TaxID=2818667 RepID=UPI002FCEC1BA
MPAVLNVVDRQLRAWSIINPQAEAKSLVRDDPNQKTGFFNLIEGLTKVLSLKKFRFPATSG